MQDDASEMEKRYLELSEAEFKGINRDDLTGEGQAIYDKEKIRRNSEEYLQELYQELSEAAFDRMNFDDLGEVARSCYTNEQHRRNSSIYREEKARKFTMAVHYRTGPGLAMLASAIILGVGAVSTGNYGSILLPIMMFIVSFRTIKGEAFQIDNARQVLTMFAMVGPLKWETSYTEIWCMEGMINLKTIKGKTKKLSPLYYNTNDWQKLINQIENL